MPTQSERRAERRKRGFCRDCGSDSAGRYRCSSCSTKEQARRTDRKKQGFCHNCGGLALGKHVCAACAKAARDRKSARHLAGLCYSCENPRQSSKSECLACQTKREARRPKDRGVGCCRDCHVRDLPLHGGRCEMCYFKNASVRHFGSTSQWEKLKARFEAQGRRCAYSGVDLELGRNASLDHIVAKFKGGSNAIENLHWVALACNEIKGTRSEEDFLRVVEAIYLHRIAPNRLV